MKKERRGMTAMEKFRFDREYARAKAEVLAYQAENDRLRAQIVNLESQVKAKQGGWDGATRLCRILVDVISDYQHEKGQHD